MAADLPERSLVAPSSDRVALEVLRDHLAVVIAKAEPSNVAALAKQYRDTLQAIAALPDGKAVNPIDELAARRAGPDAAKVQKRAASGGKSGK